MKHTLMPLPYAYDALEPHLDAKTMEIHHTKHHQTYVDKLNAALENEPTLQELSVEELLSDLGLLPEAILTAVRNAGGGVCNHNFFWNILSPQGGGEPTGALAEKIVTDFGSFADFKKKFSDAALSVFGSGWAWLVVNKGKLEIMKTPNQDSPISFGLTPLLTIDVWEHAYYLKFQNRRAEFIESWWNVVSWDAVSKLLEK